jgi:protein-S-isoprenylcysteine O-methyltransferase Ste14
MTSNPTLTLTFLLATYISAKSFRPPNPRPEHQNKTDRLFQIPGANNPKLGSYLFIILSLHHTLITAKYITPTSPSSILCPNPKNLNPRYFKWNEYTKTCLILIVVGGIARLAAYRALGTDFTFELAEPSALKTTGIYKYVQHPSYLPLIVLLTANMALFGMPDGVIGCVLSKGIVERLEPWKWVGLATWAIAWCGVIGVRVRDEEEMLEKAFGEEWRVWHGRTKRFVPWIF